MRIQRREINVLEPQRPDVTEPSLFTLEYPAVIVPRSRLPATWEAEAIARIAARAGKELTAKDVYPFPAIAASDGLDSYFTKHDVERSLKPMAEDFERGQSVLGNHDYRTFAYGQTTAGEVRPADVDAPEYEPTFYPKYADQPELRTTKWLVTEAFIARGLTLNGNQTDSVIRAMETGAIGKISISFTVGEYRCGIDGHDMLQWWGEPWPDMEEGCAHFPGVEYDEGIGYAIMSDTQALEESLVYKNASPSAMLLRKAEAMAARGILDARQVATIEARYQVRLPGFTKRLYGGLSLESGKEEPVTAKKRTEGASGAAAEEDPKPTTEGGEAEGGAAGGEADPATTEGGAEAEGGSDGDQGGEGAEGTASADQVIEEFSRAAGALVALAEASPEALAPSALETVFTVERSIEVVLEDLESERSVGREVARSHEAKVRVITDALGGELTVEAVRRLSERAAIGDELFEELVREAVAARVGVHGEGFDGKAYGEMLRGSRNVATVKAELASWRDLKNRRFGKADPTPSTRGVVPRDPREEKPARSAPEASSDKRDDNVLAKN